MSKIKLFFFLTFLFFAGSFLFFLFATVTIVDKLTKLAEVKNDRKDWAENRFHINY